MTEETYNITANDLQRWDAICANKNIELKLLLTMSTISALPLTIDYFVEPNDD
jgi:hypothetical protein